MKQLIYLTITLIFINFLPLNGQTLRGTILDKTSQSPLVEARLSIENTTLGTKTDAQGSFLFQKLAPGRYMLRVSFVGYKSVLIPDVLVSNGKENILTIGLEAGTILDDVAIKAERIDPNILSSHTFTSEEIQRFAGNYNDPARLVRSYSGVGGTNDQANHFVIRGNSPNNMAWRLEGIDIVSPNHLANGGTATDRPAANGGGVSILSMQLLGNSKFLTGAFAPEYGNATSGILDLRLRKGNDQKRETTLSASVIGIDLASEGPISKNSKSSYLVNYRYSFTGLLSALGAKLGDEDIRYQDLSFNLNFPTQNTGTFSIFGIYGTSKNIFEANPNPKLWQTQQDFSNIKYASNMNAFGLSHEISLNANTSLRTSMAVSGRNDDRSQIDFIADASLTSARAKSQFIETFTKRRFSVTTALSHKISERSNYKAGIFYNYVKDTYSNIDPFSSALPTGLNNFNANLLQPYFQFKTQLSDHLAMSLGLQSAMFKTIEPRASLSYQLSDNQAITLAYGLHSQLIRSKIYDPNGVVDLTPGAGGLGTLLKNPFPEQASGNQFMMAQHYVLGYKYSVDTKLHLKAEAYYQALGNVPVEVPIQIGQAMPQFTAYSALNDIEQLNSRYLKATGTGTNYGLELSAEHFLSKDFYYLASVSLYDAKYKGADGIERDSRFNGNYLANVTIGKEMNKIKKGKNKTFGINLRGLYQGGYRESPIDITLSKTLGKTFYADGQAFTLKMPDYFRLDLRLSWKKNKAHATRTFSLDIQNLSNQQNLAFRYYDVLQSKIVNKYQLGIIPVLGYRIEF